MAEDGRTLLARTDCTDKTAEGGGEEGGGEVVFEVVVEVVLKKLLALATATCIRKNKK